METKSEVLEVPMRRIQKSIGALLQGFVLSKGAKDRKRHIVNIKCITSAWKNKGKIIKVASKVIKRV
jgi:hypothetical protein